MRVQLAPLSSERYTPPSVVCSTSAYTMFEFLPNTSTAHRPTSPEVGNPLVILSQVLSPSVLRYKPPFGPPPLSHDELCRLLASPVPTYTIAGFDGASVTSPIDGLPTSSKTCSHVVPPFVVLSTPPAAVPT